MLDRLALGLFASILLVTFGVLCAYQSHFVYACVAVLAAWIVAHRHLTQLRHVDAADEMSGRAGQLAKLLPAAFVVMGHTHTPATKPINDGASTYINLGSWAEEEPTESIQSYKAARTHLVIHVENGEPRAELLAWDSATGPKRFVTR